MGIILLTFLLRLLRSYAEAQGSGSSAYRVVLTFEDSLKARCSCPAARRNPLCKHAAAVLAAWASAPESFVTIDEPPALDKSPDKKG